jgi:hypothetical protein
MLVQERKYLKNLLSKIADNDENYNFFSNYRINKIPPREIDIYHTQLSGETIFLRNNFSQFNNDDFNLLLHAIKNSQYLTHLELVFDISNQEIELLMNALSKNTSITNLSILF